MSSVDKLTGRDLGLTFAYNYDSSAGSGETVCAISAFLTLAN